MASSISGNLFLDENGNGLFDDGDVVWGGASVTLLNSSGATVTTTTTDANGNYSFANVANGTYSVQFTAPSGDVFSLPPAVTNGDEASSVNAAGKTAALTVAGANLTGVDAGFYTPVSISGTVFQDNNDSGQFGGTDTGVSGDTVQLLNAAGQPIAGETTTTASNGTYSFTHLTPGTYSVQVSQISTPGAVFSPLGSNAAPEPTGGTPVVENNLVTNGNFNAGGATGAAAVTQGLSGWTVSTNTAATPYGSGPGDGVEIAYTKGTSGETAYAKNGFSDTYQGAATEDNVDPYFAQGSVNDAAFFVDDDAIETLSQTVQLTAGQVYEIGFDAEQTTPGTSNPGYFELTAAINGTVITSMSSTSGVGAGTALPGGVWEHFADLYTATYTGSFTLTFTYSSGTPGSTLASKDVLVDDVYIVTPQVTPTLSTTSEVNSAGVTAPFTLTSGQQIGDESAGIYLPPATIQGTVFTDTNGDGVLDGSEAGASGRTVNLTLNGTVVATTVTASNGTYSFGNLGAGTYTVTVVAPSGDAFSPVGTSTTGTDSTVGSTGTQTVSVINGGVATVNAGIYANSTVSGTVFNDANADGVKESGESGASGVTVQLLNGSAVLATTTTGSNGSYSFSSVAPGADTVKVVAPSGDLISTNNGSATQSVTVTSGSTDNVAATGLYANASVSGTVFTDLNADGAKDGADTGLAGQTVELLSGSTVIATATTGANGSYTINNVTPGSYTVKVLPAAGDQFSTNAGSGSQAITLTSGGSATVNAGEYALSTVSGTVFADGNADGVQEAGESGASGITVELLNGSTVLATTTTGSNGSYSFSSVAPGSDTVKVVTPSGDLISTNNGSATQSVTVTSGSTDNVAATGLYANASVTGTVFTDLNADGVEDGADTGLAGQTVELLFGSTVIATATTGANGSYTINNVTPGSYTVKVLPASGDVFSTPSSEAITLTSGGSATLNAGEYALSTINGSVFNDTNADGVKESGESGASGVTVQLLNGSTVLATTTTGSNGGYSFSSVAPGADTVKVVAPSGDLISTNSGSATQSVTVTSGSTDNLVATGLYADASVSGTVFTDLNADGVEDGADPGLSGQTVELLSGSTVIATATTGANGSYTISNVTPGSYTVKVLAASGDVFSTPSSDAVTLASGGSATLNAGEYALSTINGTVFADSNADGIQEAGESGASGITVELLNGSTVLASTTTSANGGYSFANVVPGADTVKIIAPNGDLFSTNGGSGSENLTVISGSNTVINAGIYGDATVSGTVFTDLNANGTQDQGEPGLAGQTVELLSGSTVIATATSASNGSYTIGNITPGSYTVQVLPAAGDVFSTASSDATTLTSGAVSSFNVGEYAKATLGGTVFLDSNADGVEDDGEAGLGGVTVQLLDANGNPIAGATTTTAANGSYSFTGLVPGSYGVQVIPPAGLTISPLGTAASPAIDNLANPAGVIAPVTLISGASDLALNAGIAQTGSIQSFVFFDAQADGIYHVGDAGVAGVTVELRNSAGNLVASTTTNSEGGYSFGALGAGTYQVQVVAPQGTSFSPQELASGNPLLDSDVNSLGLSGSIVVQDNVTTTGANAGLVFNGDFAGQTPDVIGSGQAVASFTGGMDVVGSGDDVVFTGTGAENVVALSGGGNDVELENQSGAEDIATSQGSLMAQTLGSQNGYLFAGGSAASQMDGGPGFSFLMGGTGANQIYSGTGTNVIVAGGNGSNVTVGGVSTSLYYQAGDGLLTVWGGLRPQDSLTIVGYAGGTVERDGALEELVLGNDDKILFVGPTDFGLGATTGGDGLVFDADLLSAPVETLSFTAQGLPLFSADTGSAAVGDITPALAPTPAPSVTGSGNVVLQSGQSVLHLSGYDNNVSQAAGDATAVRVDGDLGNSVFTLGDGNNTLLLGGYNDQINLGNGDSAISGTQGNATISVGNSGSNGGVINIGGYDNLITIAGGVWNVTAGAGQDHVNTGASSDIISLAGFANSVTVSTGNDVVSGAVGQDVYAVTGFSAAGASAASLDITGFNIGGGDVLNLSTLLAQAGYTGSNLSSVLSIQSANGGADTEVFVNNGGTNYLVADLHGVSAGGFGIGHGLVA